jgi:hypothetical protein
MLTPLSPIADIHASPEVIFDAAPSAYLLGELNTEASCVALTAAPQILTPVVEINQNLEAQGAFAIEEPRRFNVQGLLKAMPDNFVTMVTDPLPGYARAQSWVQKNEGIFGTFLTGYAGALLGYSLDHNRPLRIIIGEKRRPTSEGVMHSVEIRLGVLAALQSLATTSRTGTFKRRELYELTDTFGIDEPLARRHLARLSDHKVVEDSRGKYRIRIAEKKDGSQSFDDIADLLKIVAHFAIADPKAIQEGIDRGTEIMSDPTSLALLVRRSYATSTHTGKSTKRK